MNCLLLSEGNPSTYVLAPLSSHLLKDSTQAISISPASSIFFSLLDYFHCHIVVILKKYLSLFPYSLWLPPHISASLYSKIPGKGFLLLSTVPLLSFSLELTLAGLFFTSLNGSHLLGLCCWFSVPVPVSAVKVSIHCSSRSPCKVIPSCPWLAYFLHTNDDSQTCVSGANLFLNSNPIELAALPASPSERGFPHEACPSQSTPSQKGVPAFFQAVSSKPLVFSLTPLTLSHLTFLHQKSCWFYPTSITSTMVFCLDLCTNLLNGLPSSPLIPLPSTLNITIRVILLKQLFLLPHFLNMRIGFS